MSGLSLALVYLLLTPRVRALKVRGPVAVVIRSSSISSKSSLLLLLALSVSAWSSKFSGLKFGEQISNLL